MIRVSHRRKQENVIVWSVHKFNLADDCLLKHFYHYLKKQEIPKTGVMALGHLLHKKQERFFKEDLDFRPREGIEKFYAPTNVPRNKSAAAFAATCINNWNYFIGLDYREKDPRKKVCWGFPGEPFVLLDDLKKIAPEMYERSTTQQNPIFTEFGFNKIRLRHEDL